MWNVRLEHTTLLLSVSEQGTSTVTTPVTTEVIVVIKRHIVQVYSANIRATVTFKNNKVILNCKMVAKGNYLMTSSSNSN